MWDLIYSVCEKELLQTLDNGTIFNLYLYLIFTSFVIFVADFSVTQGMVA